MQYHFKLGNIPAGIPVIRPSHIAILYVIGGICGADVNRECRFHQLMGFMHIDLGLKINAALAGIYAEVLPDIGLAVFPFHVDHRVQRAVFRKLHGYQVLGFPHFLLVEQIDIPGITHIGSVLKELQDIAPLPGSQYLSSVLLIIKAGKLSFFIECNLVVWSGEDVSVKGKDGFNVWRLFFRGRGFNGCQGLYAHWRDRAADIGLSFATLHGAGPAVRIKIGGVR